MNRTCPECGRPLNGMEQSCPDCGFPLQNQRPNSNYYPNSNHYIEDEGDNKAEEMLRRYLNSFKIFFIVLIIIWGIVATILSIKALGTIGPAGLIGIIGAIFSVLIGIAIVRILWAAGMIFINISTNVRKIKHKLNSIR